MNCYFVNWQSFREFRVRETAPPLQDRSPLMVRVLLNRFRSLARKIRNFGAPGKRPEKKSVPWSEATSTYRLFCLGNDFRIRPCPRLFHFNFDLWIRQIFSRAFSKRDGIGSKNNWKCFGFPVGWKKKVSVGFRNSAERVFELRYPPIWWII